MTNRQHATLMFSICCLTGVSIYGIRSCEVVSVVSPPMNMTTCAAQCSAVGEAIESFETSSVSSTGAVCKCHDAPKTAIQATPAESPIQFPFVSGTLPGAPPQTLSGDMSGPLPAIGIAPGIYRLAVRQVVK